MTTRSSPSSSGCPMQGLLETLNRSWTLHILWALTHEGETRFGVLRRAVPGISARMLALRLKDLESCGFISRHDRQSNPPEVSYRLTERMQDVSRLLDGFHDLAIKWNEDAALRA